MFENDSKKKYVVQKYYGRGVNFTIANIRFLILKSVYLYTGTYKVQYTGQVRPFVFYISEKCQVYKVINNKHGNLTTDESDGAIKVTCMILSVASRVSVRKLDSSPNFRKQVNYYCTRIQRYRGVFIDTVQLPTSIEYLNFFRVYCNWISIENSVL